MTFRIFAAPSTWSGLSTSGPCFPDILIPATILLRARLTVGIGTLVDTSTDTSATMLATVVDTSVNVLATETAVVATYY